MSILDRCYSVGQMAARILMKSRNRGAVVLLVLLGLGGCRPGLPTHAVAFSDSIISEAELRSDLSITLLIRAEEALPIVEIKVEIPPAVRNWGVARFRGEFPFKESRGGKTFVSHTRGEIPVGEGKAFPIVIQSAEAKPGDVLSFPTELTLSDSSVIVWAGPPGSERPAPRLVVMEARGIEARTFLLVAAFALVLLLSVGAWKARQRRKEKP